MDKNSVPWTAEHAAIKKLSLRGTSYRPTSMTLTDIYGRFLDFGPDASFGLVMA